MMAQEIPSVNSFFFFSGSKSVHSNQKELGHTNIFYSFFQYKSIENDKYSQKRYIIVNM